MIIAKGIERNWIEKIYRKRVRFYNKKSMHKSIPIMTRAGTAFHSNQNVMNDEVTRMMPGMKTVVK